MYKQEQFVLFTNIFLDGDIVENFAYGKTNSSYIVSYGLAPHLKSILHDTLTNIDVFVAIFYKSFENIS